MKIIKFAVCAIAGSLALLANQSQAASGVAITVSLTTYSQVTSTNSAGVITFSTNSTTWNNATILAKVQTTTGITLPAGAKLGVSTIDGDDISAGDVVILDKSGNILYDLNEFETSTGFVEISFEVDPVVKVTKTAKMSTATQFTGPGQFNAFFDLFGVEDTAEVKKGGFFGSVVDAFDLVDLTATGSVTQGTFGNRLTSGNFTMSGAGEYGHFDDTSFTETFQPADATFSGAASAVPFNTFPFFNQED